MSQPGNVAMQPEAKWSATPTIAIIGMEGSGKTVLAATLAKRFSTTNPHGVLIVPIGVKTLTYVERVWGILQGGDWPPSTPPGELFELHWNYRVGSELNCDVRLVDAAGQDLRLLFGAERIHDRAALPSQLRSIAEYCYAADIVLYLVNMRDSLGQPEHETRVGNEAALKSAMDCLCQRKDRRVCLVLTQSDLYQDLATQAGGWERLVETTLPYIFTAHVNPAQLKIIPVAAVLDTEVIVDREDGMPRRVPVADFQSRGLKTLLGWICTQARTVQKERARQPVSYPVSYEALPQESQADSTSTFPSVPPPPAKSVGEIVPGKSENKGRRQLIKAVAVVIALLVFMRACIPQSPETAGTTAAPPTAPVPVVFGESSRKYVSFFTHYFEKTGSVRNTGPAGTVRVWAQLFENGTLTQTKYSDFYLRPKEVKDFRFDFWDLDHNDQLEIRITAQAR